MHPNIQKSAPKDQYLCDFMIWYLLWFNWFNYNAFLRKCKHYWERFHVDAVTAAKDLQELGVNYAQEQLDQIKQAEEQRLRQRRMEREAKERKWLAELYADCDDRFAFIVGYTDGGAPYGVMWEEVGIDMGLPFEEKVKLYHMQMLGW